MVVVIQHIAILNSYEVIPYFKQTPYPRNNLSMSCAVTLIEAYGLAGQKVYRLKDQPNDGETHN